jgi:hypothetical protein
VRVAGGFNKNVFVNCPFDDEYFLQSSLVVANFGDDGRARFLRSGYRETAGR